MLPGARGRIGASQVTAAKAVGQRCPVRTTCLRCAMPTAQDHGIRGGGAEEQRRQARRGPAVRRAG